MKSRIDLDWCGLRITAQYEYEHADDGDYWTPPSGSECSVYWAYVQETNIIEVLSEKQILEIEKLVIKSYEN